MMNVTEAADRYLAGEHNDPEVLSALESGSDENGRLYYKLHRSLRHGKALETIPELFKEIIKTKAWEHWHWIGSEFRAHTLGEYLTKPPPSGIGATLEIVEKLIREDAKALTMFRKETKRPAHRPPKSNGSSDNVTTSKRGNSLAYTLERLADEHPDLHSRVVAGELSANAAAKLAGWRIQKTHLELLRMHWSKASEPERETFKQEIARE